MSQIYERGETFVVTGGDPTCFELYAPTRGVLKKFVIKQTGGAAEGFKANLYNRRDACADVSMTSGTFDSQEALDPELHRVIAEIDVAAPGVISAQYDLEAGYQNLDEQDIRRTPKSRLYLEIEAGGSGQKEFQVAYGIRPMESV